MGCPSSVPILTAQGNKSLPRYVRGISEGGTRQGRGTIAGDPANNAG